jgi:putative ABC transport system ATP-binding protein
MVQESPMTQSASEPALTAESLEHWFSSGESRVDVLRGVTLSLHRNEVTILMGPSGSGKTVLLALLSGLLRPRSGRVQVLGRDLWAMSDADRRRFRLDHFGFIFQASHLFPGLSIRQQLEMVLCWGDGMSASAAQPLIKTALHRFALDDKEQRFPEQLSGGEKQRVGIARALLRHPDFCFADEPTASLDWHNGEQVVRQFVTAARERGTTVLLVTHDSRLLPFADRVLYLEDGQLLNHPTTVPAGPSTAALQETDR